MKFCNNTNFTLPKQSQRSRSVLLDGSRSLGLFWKEKTLSYSRRITFFTFIIFLRFQYGTVEKPNDPPLHHFPPMDEYFNDGFHSDVIVSHLVLSQYLLICLFAITENFSEDCVGKKKPNIL